MTLEKLLNILCEKGWKPRGKNYGVIDFLGTLVFVDLNDGRLSSKNALDLRKLTSKESGLWQFVCENGMLKDDKLKHNWISQVEWGLDIYCKRKTTPTNYEYRLIESALCDEDKLESFILDNIKIDE